MGSVERVHADDALRIVRTAMQVCEDRDRPAMAEDLESVELYIQQTASLTAAQQPVQEGGGEPVEHDECPVCENNRRFCANCGSTGFVPATAPPSAPAGLDPPVERQRDLLAQAIRDAAVKAGIARADSDMTGPMLLMLCDDMADCILAQQPAQAAPGEFVVIDGRSYALDTVRTALLGLAANVAATPPADDAAGGGHGR